MYQQTPQFEFSMPSFNDDPREPLGQLPEHLPSSVSFSTPSSLQFDIPKPMLYVLLPPQSLEQF